MFHLKKVKSGFGVISCSLTLVIARKGNWQHPIDFCCNNLWPILPSAKIVKSFPSVFIWKSTCASYHFYQLFQLLYSLCPCLVSVLSVGHLCSSGHLTVLISQLSEGFLENVVALFLPTYLLFH